MEVAKHPAKFSDPILAKIETVMWRNVPTLDPFVGVGRIYEICPWPGVVGVEIEPDWACADKRSVVGDSQYLPFPDATFSQVITSSCYGNRMADHHAAMDASKRHTYRHYLGHELKPQNAGGMAFGKRATSPYKVLHRNVWIECYRVMTEDSQLILNISNHMKTERGVNKKTGEKWKKTYEVEVAQWHRNCLREIGFKLEQVIEVPTKRNRHGRNGDVRCDVEYVSVFRKGNIK